MNAGSPLFSTGLAILIGLGLLPARADGPGATGASTNSLVIYADRGTETISRNIYGQFSEHLSRCVYEGIWVEPDSLIPNTRGIRNDVVAALKKTKVPVVRWPGGCFADEYHWKDGIGPPEKRPAMINTTWGGGVENNHFGTHEFLDFCEQIGAAPYLCGNVGSGTVQEMMEWVEYTTSGADSPLANLRRRNGREQPWKVPFFAVGNESWGCGGNMTADYQLSGEKIPCVSASASRDKSGTMHVTFCNLDPNRPAEVVCEVRGTRARKLSGRVLTAAQMNAHNTFADPAAVMPAGFSAFKTAPEGFSATLPPKSVVVRAVE
jgi:alpha-L-arabinofuranosidase